MLWISRLWILQLRSEQVSRQHPNKSGLSTAVQFPINCVATFEPPSHHRRIHWPPHRAALVRHRKERDTTRLHSAEWDHEKSTPKKSTPNVVEQRQWRREIVQLDNREGPRQRLPRADLICSPQVWRLVTDNRHRLGDIPTPCICCSGVRTSTSPSPPRHRAVPCAGSPRRRVREHGRGFSFSRREGLVRPRKEGARNAGRSARPRPRA